MDDRNGQLYPDRETALMAGVPKEHLKEVSVKVIMSGPFKGRRYAVYDDGTQGRRIFPNASTKQIEEINEDHSSNQGSDQQPVDDSQSS